jgi:signal transduction histidine kinase/ActR/RegA family two-component response regulator
MTPQHSAQPHRPSFPTALVVCTLITAAMIVVRLGVHARFVPLADSLPLLICLWARYRRLLWAMAVTLTTVSLLRTLLITPLINANAPINLWLSAFAIIANVWLTTGVLHALLNIRERLEQKNDRLERINDELESVNERLIVRDIAIQHQNEELHRQTGALEQQAEALERQSAALHELNEQLARREKALEALLDSSRWLRTDLDQQAIISRICEVAQHVMEGDAHAISIVQRQDDQLILRGCTGLGPAGPARNSWPYEKSFAAIVMEQNRTGFLPDTSLCPDIEILEPSPTSRFQSVLATPLRISGSTHGAVVIYSHTPRQWNEKTFKIVEWLAGQIALVIEAIDLQVQLHQRRSLAEEDSLRKTRFLTAISHDVRTPANAINLMAELISRASKGDIPSSEIADMARDLQSSARLLVDLVSDVLDLARFDSAALDLQKDEFELWPIIHAEVKQLLPLAKEQNLKLQALLPTDPVWLRTDRMKLARVVGNLIGNAIKFTEAGGAEIRGIVLADNSLQIQVIDTGIGIDPHHLTDIFDEFHQLRNPARDRSKGTGLGLAICKRLVSAIGCTLSVDSTPNRGSTFTLHIPAALRIPSPSLSTNLLGSQSRHTGRLAGLRILLVEDHEMTRRATAKILAAEGATVMQAEHGKAALQLLAHDFPQVLLLDLMLPDMDGADILRKLQTHCPASLKCMLAISGDVTQARADQVQSLGATALIPKPVDIDHLVNTINASLPPTTKALAQLNS